MSSVLRSFVNATSALHVRARSLRGTGCAVCLEFSYSNKINMLHQDNDRVQKARLVTAL